MRAKGSAKVLADRRRRALKLVDKGLSLNAAARSLVGITRTREPSTSPFALLCRVPVRPVRDAPERDVG